MSDNYGIETKPLFKMLRTEAFRFIIININHFSLIEQLKTDLQQKFPQRNIVSLDAEKVDFKEFLVTYQAQKNGFILLKNFEYALKRPKFSRQLNRRRDFLAKSPIAIIVFMLSSSERKHVRKIMEELPDLWSFRSLLLDLKKETKARVYSTPGLYIDSPSISSLGGNTEKLKKEELARLKKLVEETPLSETVFHNLLQEQIAILERETSVEEPAIKYTSKELTEYHFTDDELRAAAEKIELATLKDSERKLLSILAVLPSEPIPVDDLEELSGLGQLDKLLESFVEKKWVSFDGEVVEVVPIIQAVVKLSNHTLLEDSNGLILKLNEKLNYDSGGYLINTTYDKAANNARYSEHVLANIKDNGNDVILLYNRIGVFFATQANLEKALKYFEEGLRISKELQENHPYNIDFKRNPIAFYLNLNFGKIQRSLGNLEKALKYFEDGLRISEELQENHPSNVYFKRNLAVSYSNLGEIHSSLGNLEKALKYFEEGLRISKELQENHPSNIGFKRNLTVFYSNLGETERSQGNLEEALKYFEDGLRVSKELQENHLSNVDFKRNLAVSYSNLGGIHSSQGYLEKALKYFEKYSTLVKELHTSVPSNVEFKNSLAVSYTKLALAHLKETPSKSKQYLLQAEKLFQELRQLSPQNVNFKRDLHWTQEKLKELTS